MGGSMSTVFSQSFFIAKPTLTEDTLKDQAGRVFIVTGGYTGVGLELAKLLYQRNGTIYVAGRSKEKADKAISDLKKNYPDSKGKLAFLELDLSDLTTIKPAVEQFTSAESRLDVLTNNAGVMVPPPGSKTKQGHELQMGTNCLGPYLLTILLLPTLSATAKEHSDARVTWAASLATELQSPKDGVTFDSQGAPAVLSKENNYGQSKLGNVILAREFARRRGPESDVISAAWNPGNLRTELQRHLAPFVNLLIDKLLLFPPHLGGYTELFAGWSPDITMQNSGAYVVPWGQLGHLSPKKDAATKPQAEGGTGAAEKFWDWCEKETKQYM